MELNAILDFPSMTREEQDACIANLDIRVTVPVRRYISGQGFVGEHKQHELGDSVSFQWGQNPRDFGLQGLPYDFQLQFGEETMRRIPNLFCLNNGLPRHDELEIHDTGYESRCFIILDSAIVIRGTTITNTAHISEILWYVLKVLTDTTILVATRRDTRRYFTPEDAQLLHNVVDGNSAKKNAGRLRELAVRISLFSDVPSNEGWWANS